MPDTLYLLKVPVRADRLFTFAQQRGFPQRLADVGYLVHCVFRETWQREAPGPFVVRGSGRNLDVWGYSNQSADALRCHAQEFGDPANLAVIGDLDQIAGRAMPLFETGRRVGFRLRACPVVRLALARNGHRAGAEVDAFLAKCFQTGEDAAVSREAVYRGWLLSRLANSATSGAESTRIAVIGMSRDKVIRRTHDERRVAKSLERPDVHYEGELIVRDGRRFLEYLAAGVGRHRAFGFGALMVVPPSSSQSA